jgi:hypothetical protein
VETHFICVIFGGGLESARQINRDLSSTRHDAVQHDVEVESDYGLIRDVGFGRRAMEFRWHLIDRGNYYDLFLVPAADAAQNHGVQVIWNPCITVGLTI